MSMQQLPHHDVIHSHHHASHHVHHTMGLLDNSHSSLSFDHPSSRSHIHDQTIPSSPSSPMPSSNNTSASAVNNGSVVGGGNGGGQQRSHFRWNDQMTFHLARALLRYVQTHQKYPPSTGHGVAKAASGWDEIAQSLAAATTSLSSPMVTPTGKQCETRWGTYRCTIAPRMAMMLYNTIEQAMKTYYAQHHRDEDMDDVIEVWKAHFKLVEGFYPLIVDDQSDVIPRELREQLHEILQHQQDQEENDMTIYRIGREVYDICLRNRVDLNEKARSKTANRLKHRTKRDAPDMAANSDQSALPSAESTETKKTAKRQKRNAVQSMESSQGVPSLALPTLPSLPYDDDSTGNTVDNGENNTLSSNTSSSALYHSSDTDTTSDIIASFNETLIAVAGDIINAIYSIKQKPRITDRFPTLNEWFRLLQLNDNEINTVSRQYQLLDITHIYGCNDVTMLMAAGIPKHKAMRWVHEADRYE